MSDEDKRKITYPVTTDKELPLCKDIADFALCSNASKTERS